MKQFVKKKNVAQPPSSSGVMQGKKEEFFKNPNNTGLNIEQKQPEKEVIFIDLR